MYLIQIHCLIFLLYVALNINLIRSQSYYGPEVRNEEEPDYYQQPASPTNDNEQDFKYYENGEDVVHEDGDVGDGANADIEEEETEEIEIKEDSQNLHGAIKTTQAPIKVDLDQLVEKVRERLLGDVEGQNTLRVKQQVKQSRMVAHSGFRPKGIQPPNKKIEGNGKVFSKVIEEHELYKKTAFKKGKKDEKDEKDSYEDYVIPKKDENALISVEEELTSPTIQTKHHKILRKPEKKMTKGSQGQANKATRGQWGKATRKQGPDEQKPSQKQKPKRIFPNRKKKTTYIVREYDDTSPPSTPQLKVRTEIIGQIDYKDLSAESKAKLLAKEATSISKQAKIVTNMQKRVKFTFSSPNYYAKLPRIAEKYNFNEPIPQKDQEEEKLKEIVYDRDVLINKKIQVNQQPTLPMQSSKKS